MSVIKKLSQTFNKVQEAITQILDNVPSTTEGYDDFAFSVTNLTQQGANTKPDKDLLESEWLFDSSSVETLIGSKISQHEFKIGPGVVWYPHVHWAQSELGKVVWQLQYKIWAANTLEPAWTTINNIGIDDEFTYTTGVLHQISELPEIDMSPYESTALEVKIRFSRLGNDAADNYSPDARFMGFDFHVPKDQPRGSRQVFIK